MEEEWIPNDEDIETIFSMDQGILGMEEPSKKRARPDDGSDDGASSSDDDGADLEMEMERQMRSQVQDVQAIRRLKHRIISRKSRAKKKRDMEALQVQVQELEATVKRLQASSSVALVSNATDRKTAYLRLFAEADRLREENRNLKLAIEKHVGFANSVQSSIAAVEKWEKENIVLAALCDFVVFHALSPVQFECLRQKTLSECASLALATDAPQRFQGWDDFRRTDFPPPSAPHQQTSSVPARASWVSSKILSLPSGTTLQTIADKTWRLYQEKAACERLLPYLRKLEVLQIVNEDAFVCRRDLLFPHAKTQRVHYTTLLVLRASQADGRVTFSVKTMDNPITDTALGDSEAWLHECVELTLSPAPNGACHVRCRGFQDNAMVSYAKPALVELLAVLLRWEAYVLEPPARC
ncbi:hypothetical protein SDRG_00879 [Saprolegnia diclina VS20]|uniref:BZIP domain-containing protein n=1 Tax=Saprolegnia diclina (strain VS20) TaxID=1156394 RepID=T0R6G1_SAPDV|nr:hypothetical protein SDRG_00879 [Saprolegnia diclina VS20]EQC42035.1 hypothetical protein SDRG_00879 [Saprolegnia diclina VS20]|eukprot:XP_008604604.1 hypothetical protein SDRG_00879 [Saprolegnia diclina VS20]